MTRDAFHGTFTRGFACTPGAWGRVPPWCSVYGAKRVSSLLRRGDDNVTKSCIIIVTVTAIVSPGN